MKHKAPPLYRIFLVIAIVALIVYGIYNSRYMLQGPQIVLAGHNPKTNTIETYQKDFTLQGTSTHVSFISINERPISVNEKGFFEERFLLSEEINPLKIIIRDRFGKEITQNIKIIYSKDPNEQTFDEIFSTIRSQLNTATSSDTDDPALLE